MSVLSRRRFLQAAAASAAGFSCSGWLPRSVQHERSWEMLVWQALHEPDAAGRSDALLALADLCKTPEAPSPCAGLPALLHQRAEDDPARVVRQIAERAVGE